MNRDGSGTDNGDRWEWLRGTAVRSTLPLGDGKTETWSYNVDGHQTGFNGGASPGYNNTTTWLGDFITSSTDNVNGNWSYTYDDFARLSSAVGSQTFNYSYDEHANRWGTVAGVNQFTFDGATNHITSGGITYDAAGNMTYDGFHTYTYDGENRLKQVDSGNSPKYGYDSFGNRSMQYAPPIYNEYVVDLSGRAITAIHPGTSTVYTAEVNAGGRHWVTDNGSALFIGPDWVGTQRALTNLSGTFDQLCTSLPFGDSLSCTGTGYHSTSHYTDKEYDPESNLYHFPARQYAPVQGRWLTPDPAGLAAVDPSNPQTWNGYVYVTNNPLSYIDPLGLLDDPIVCPASIGSCGGGGDSYGTSYTIDGVEVSASMVQAALGSGFGVFGPANAGYGHSQAGANGGSYTLIAVAGDSWAWVNNYNGEELSPEAAAEAGLNGTMPGESTSTGPPDPTNMDKALFCNKRLRKQAGRAFGVTQNGTARSGLAEAGFSIDLGSNGLAFGPMVNSVYSDGIANQLGIVTGPGTIAILHTHGNMVLPTPSSGDLNSVFPNFVVSRYSWYVTVPATHKYVELNSSACR